MFVQISRIITTLPNLDEKRPIETHPYELLKIMSTHHVPLHLTNVHRFSLKNEVPIYRESNLQIPTKTIEYVEVKEHSLLTDIVNDFDKDIDLNSSFETCFEVFTHPKSLDTPK